MGAVIIIAIVVVALAAGHHKPGDKQYRVTVTRRWGRTRTEWKRLR